MSTELVHVPFHGGEILAVKSEQGEFAVIKPPLCRRSPLRPTRGGCW